MNIVDEADYAIVRLMVIPGLSLLIAIGFAAIDSHFRAIRGESHKNRLRNITDMIATIVRIVLWPILFVLGMLWLMRTAIEGNP